MLTVVATVLVAVLATVSPAAGAGAGRSRPTQSVQEELAKFGALVPADISDIDALADLAPDISLLVDRPGAPTDSPVADDSSTDDGSSADEPTTGDGSAADEPVWWIAVREELLDQPGVVSVAVDILAADATVFHIGLDEIGTSGSSVGDVAAALVELTEAEASDGPVSVSVTAGGRALTDETIVNRFATTVRWLAFGALLLAGFVLWRCGPKRGAVMALAWVGSVLLAGRITTQVVGPFDGTPATGPLVGAVAGLLFALVVGLRLLKWWEDPQSGDGAEAIQRSLAEVASDVILVLGGLMAVVGVLWIAGGSSRALVAVVVGGLVGAAFTGAVVAPALAAVGPADEPFELVPYPVPSGGQLMVMTVLGLIGVLLVLTAFGFRSPSGDLIDYRALPSDDAGREIGDLLGSGPGDPTEALVSVVDAASPQATGTWAEAVATLDNVAWVDTMDRRYTAAGAGSVDPALSLASEEQIGFASAELAVIVPAVPIRSLEGAQLVDEVVRLADERVEVESAAGPVGRGSTTLVVAIVVLLALAGAGTVMVETDNPGHGLTSFVFRLLGGGATVGLYRLVSADSTAVEVIAALTVVTAAVGLFELEYLHDRARFGDRWSTSAGLVTIAGSDNGDHTTVNGSGGHGGPDPGELEVAAAASTDAHEDLGDPSILGGLGVPGRASMLATLGLLAAGFWMSATRFAGGGPTVGRFGFALAVALVIEFALGFLILRPALLGEQAAYHSVARPLRSTLHAGQRRQRNQPVLVDDPGWRRLVSDLLMAEFRLQTDPDSALVDEVFLEGTPLFGQAAEQHRNLLSSGLRVSGRAPKMKRVEIFREGPSIMVSVTVDHPERHLVDQDGTVYGVRRPQRRSTMLWLVGLDSGAVRIAESIDMGSVPLDVDTTPDKTSFPEVATVSG